ncbi:MAG: sensor histidine kinase [Chitinophagales bacterium]
MKRGRLLIKSIALHFLGWFLLFFGWYFFRVNDFPNHLLTFWVTLVKVAGLAFLVYLTNYLLIPKLLYRKKYFLFGTVYLILIFLTGLLKVQINERILAPYFHAHEVFSDFKERIYDNIIPLFLLTSTVAALKLVIDYVRSERRLAEISREKSETELQFLKSQINPHFLFNSLNSVYFLIDKQNTEARQTLLQFADLLRYQLYECNADTIQIEKELTYIMDYIHLQQLRKDTSYDVEVKTEQLSGFRIVPLLLIPFVENAFKHISHHSNQKNYVNLELSRRGDRFYFYIQNSRDEVQEPGEPGSGIGLMNVKRRLALLYPDHHELSIKSENGTFSVELELAIQEG